ncbi:MAG: type II toxin-antitoxin system PemK/MazF family toxin [Acidobacteriota bacterium]
MKSKSPGIAPLRGEIWWVALDPVLGSEIAKTRPCVVLSRDTVNQLRRTVVVVPLSSSPTPHPPIHVAVRCSGKPAVAVVDQVRAVSKQRLVSRLGCLTEEETRAIGAALQQVLDLG